jgi:hypothetical protein
VAEHLPIERARSFIGELTSRSQLVLFSAAIPFQGGVGHVNEQWQSYWAGLFAERGYRTVDVIRPMVWTNRDVSWWYAQNIILYVTPERLAELPALSSACSELPRLPLDIVHPSHYAPLADDSQMSVRRAGRGLLAAMRRKLRLGPSRNDNPRLQPDSSRERPA